MIKNEMNDYYKTLIKTESEDPKKVGWRDRFAQEIRFQQLYRLVEGIDRFDIADLGCGLAGFYTFLKERKRNFSYVGYDLSEDMIREAKKALGFNNLKVSLELIGNTKDISEHEFIVISGIFNIKRNISNEKWLEYILDHLNIVNQKSSKGFAFNLLTSYSDEEFKKDDLYYASPTFFFDYCKKNFARNVALLHDYDEYDFTIIVRK